MTSRLRSLFGSKKAPPAKQLETHSGVPKFFTRNKIVPLIVPEVRTGDRPKPRYHGQKVEGKELRELCELIRTRYSLDIEIWSLRQAKTRDRWIVEDLMRKSDATLAKINRILDNWDVEDAFTFGEELQKLKEIKRRMQMEGKRDWSSQPPWQKAVSEPSMW